MREHHLPGSWIQVPLKELATRITKGSTPTSYGFKFQQSGIRFIKIENIRDGKIDHKNIKQFISDEANLSQSRSILQEGDILYSIAGTIGTTCFVNEADLPANTNQALAIIRGTQSYVDSQFLRYFLRSNAAARQADLVARGGGMNNISLEDVGKIEVPLPPREEQRRIVEKLDEVMDKIEIPQTRLKRVPHMLKRFRLSVLKAACSGNLTVDWREKNPLHARTGEATRILDTLQAKRGKIVDITLLPSLITDLPILPTSWTWSYLTELGDLKRGRSQHRPRNDTRLFGGPYPFIQTGDVARSKGRVTNHKQTYSEFGLEQSRLFPSGTLCITIAANIADTAILTYPACFPDSVVGFIGEDGYFKTEFAQFFIQVAQSELETFAPATAQKNINLEILSKLPIPLPPFEEQDEIVRRVNELFALANRIEERYLQAKTHFDRLSASVLAKAFRGELVPQNPDDESAEVLLERLRSEKQTQPAKQPRKAKARSSPQTALF